MGKMLVTGGAGFIGSHVVDELVSMGKDVIVLDDLSGGFKDNLNEKAEFVNGDIRNDKLVAKLFKENEIEYVFHLAAYAAEGLSHFIKKYNYENNLMGSIHLINEAIKSKVKCFVFTSSIAVYGKNQLPMTEETTPQPEDPYGISKYAIEQELEVSRKMFGLNYIVFRPHNVYGEKQNIGDKYRNVVGIFMNQIMQGKPISIFGDGSQTRAFSYVGDVAPIIAKSIFVDEAYNQVFNIGADDPYSVKELANVVVKHMKDGDDHEVNHHPERNEVMHAYSAHEKVKKVFNHETKYDLNEGVKRMAAWAKIVGARESKHFENIEITENLPESWLKKD
jgi:UDP-glucose 4-epimerase